MEMTEWISKNSWCVYKHTAPNGKIYIGITNNTKNRWRKDGSGYKTQTIFWRAIQKYGWESFEHEIIAWDLTLYVAQMLEMDLIFSLKSNDKKFGYNITDGGQDIWGPNAHSPESIEKAKLTKKAKLAAGIHTARYGQKLSPELKNKLSEAHKGLMCGPNHPMYGKHHTEETKEKLRQANLGKKQSEETKQKKREKMLGRYDGEKHPMHGTKHSEEHKAKISESLKKAYAENKRTPIKAGEKKVFQYSLEGDFIAEYPSRLEASKSISRSSSSISDCINGKRKTCAGYLWKDYKTEKL